MTQGCNNVVEVSSVFVSGSNLNCSGAVILSKLTPTQTCTNDHVISHANAWIKKNSRSDIRVEKSHETGAVCRPEYTKRRVCSVLGLCAGYKTYRRCRLELDPKGPQNYDICASSQPGDIKQEMLSYCADLV